MSEKTILLVDDDQEIVKTVQHYLQQEGYAVLVAYNGKDALAIVRDQSPDCLVLDVMLPDHDGWEITQRIRADKRSAEIPIIMLTARIDDMDKVQGLELGAVLRSIPKLSMRMGKLLLVNRPTTTIAAASCPTWSV